MGKLLSVIIPNYNNEKYLEECLLSILENKPEWLEVILVDGLSSDGSMSIADRFSEKLDLVISEKDYGQSDALNKGFSVATGLYVTWLNSDDAVVSDSVKLLENLLTARAYDVVTLNTVLIDEESCVRSFHASIQPHAFLFDYYSATVIGGPAAIIKKEILKAPVFDVNLNYVMDIDLYRRLFKCNVRIKRVDMYFWMFRVHLGSKTSPSLLGKANERHLIEGRLIAARYNYVNWKLFLGRVILKTQRLCSFSLYRSLFYTYKYRGKRVSSFK